jgi:hypothetical protein
MLAVETVSRGLVFLALILTFALAWGAGALGAWQAFACLSVWSIVVFVPLAILAMKQTKKEGE